MSFKFTDSDIAKIAKILDSHPENLEDAWSWRLENPRNKQSLVMTIYNDVKLGRRRKGPLVSVQTHHGYYELHECQSYLIFDPDEVIFINGDKNHISSLIVGKLCSCSMYANISRDILSADFANLDPAVLLSAMQLSIAEDILPR